MENKLKEIFKTKSIIRRQDKNIMIKKVGHSQEKF